MRLSRCTFIVVIAGLLILSLLIAGCSESAPQETAPATATPTVNPTEQATEEATVSPTEEPPVTTPEVTAEPTAQVESYDLEISVLKTEKWESLGEFVPKPGNIFFVVVFEITNHGAMPYEYHPDFVLVEDEDGNEWSIVPSWPFQEKVLIKPMGQMTIEPGMSVGGGLVFGVPQSSQTYPRLLLYDDKGSIVASAVIGTVTA